MNQMRTGYGMGLGGCSRSVEKWADSGYILKAEQTGWNECEVLEMTPGF